MEATDKFTDIANIFRDRDAAAALEWLSIPDMRMSLDHDGPYVVFSTPNDKKGFGRFKTLALRHGFNEEDYICTQNSERICLKFAAEDDDAFGKISSFIGTLNCYSLLRPLAMSKTNFIFGADGASHCHDMDSYYVLEIRSGSTNMHPQLPELLVVESCQLLLDHQAPSRRRQSNALTDTLNQLGTSFKPHSRRFISRQTQCLITNEPSDIEKLRDLARDISKSCPAYMHGR